MLIELAFTLLAVPALAGELSSIPASSDSGVEITYVRGHNEHRLVATQRDGKARARSQLDKKTLSETPIESARYGDFLTQASEFLLEPRRGMAGRFPCRTPFSVTVWIGKERRQATGCRSVDEKALGLLVRRGEDLIHRSSLGH